MTRKKKSMVLLLLLPALAILASCGSAEPQADAGPASVWGETRYAAEYIPLEAHNGIFGAAIWEDAIYFSTYSTPVSFQTDLFVLDQTSETVTLLTGYDHYTWPPLTPEQEAALDADDDQVEIIRYFYQPWHISPAKDHLWIMATRQRVSSGYDIYPDDLLLLLADPADGGIRQEIVLSSDGYDDTHLSLCCDAQGNAYATFGKGIFIYAPDGTALGQIPAQRGKLLSLPDGRSGFLSDTMDGTQWQFRPIDLKTLSFKGEYRLNSVTQDAFSKNYIKVFTGTARYDFFCANDLSLYGCRLGTDGSSGTVEHILTWTDCDIDGTGVQAVRETEDGFLCVVSSAVFGPEIIQLRPRDPSEQEPATVTLACQELPYDVSWSVLRFNRQSSDVRVQIRDYGAISAKSGLATGLDQFTADLISGNVSDLFYTGNLDEQMLIDRGLLEDLWPWIDGDAELGGREALVQPLFNAMSQNGKLYAVTDSFRIRTAIGYKDMVGDQEGWSVDELLEAYQSRPDCRSILPLYWYNRESELERVIAMCAESFIDRQNWTASFDSPEFAKLLEYLTFIPEELMEREDCEDWLLNREQLMHTASISSIHGTVTPFYRFLKTEPSEGTIVGYPGVAGNGGSFRVDDRMAMWAGSSRKEEAWQFLRFLLLPENQRDLSWGIPSNREACEALIQELYEDGVWVHSLKPFPWTQADTDRFWSYVDGITVAERIEENIAVIIRDEAARFFSGDQTAEAAAKAVQSRVNLYLGERKK